ncbi:lysophospholipid acyltransferase family protein [Actinophytocola sp.]|uniref:lysophospholipid acyltransferase family protein n=1 Tax=Actinophytocola sp. TaxID=1872138 RepID=UPI002D5B2329|nr:lysophospholipid acyltransferase family protein [Actinophytocola sp.]HYQ65695.1 lysophospholipid acyltransferase family protein [Actinophytocola sp.]
MNHAWFPHSPCGPGCLGGQEPTVGRILRTLRIAGLLAVVLLSLLSLVLLPVVGRTGRNWLTRAIFRGVLLAMGVRLVVHGTIPGPGRGALVVNNHTSWLDIVAVNAVRPMRAVAKLDIASWPVLGWLVSAAGSIYVDRANIRSLSGTVTTLADSLRAGSMVNVTPEGTTWCGLTHGRFRPALFQAAIDGGVPVLPVALRFRLRDGARTTAPAFIGDETIVDSVRRTAALRGLVLEVHVRDEIAPGRAGDRRELATLAERAVDDVLTPATLPAEKHWTSSTVEVAP